MNKEVEEAIFGGGCFWCTEAVFQRIEGVEEVVPGYTGGHIKNPAYKEVCSGRTGHAEVIKISFNSSQVSYRSLLEVFFATHDPTTLNRQGNDIGTQYRSAIFYTSEAQKKEADAYINTLSEGMDYENPIVTEVKPLEVFYEAEETHQNYYNENKQQSYCQFIITPKVEKMKERYSEKLKK